MIGGVIAWFATSRVGQAIAAGFAIAAAIGVAVLKVFSAGKAAERAKQDAEALDATRTRARINDEIKSLPIPERAKRLKEWSPRE